MAYFAGSPPTPPEYGYSCQVWLTLEIGGELFGTSNRYAWFSTVFNPIDNVDSSNPCLGYYLLLSRAVQDNDVGNRLIRDYKTQLLGLVNDEEAATNISSSQANDYRREILAAAISSYRPEVWRLDLQTIANRVTNGNVTVLKDRLQLKANSRIKPPQILQPNEYLIDDLQANEYDVIIIG